MRELTTDEALKYIWKTDTKREKTSKYRAEIEAFLDSGAMSAELDNPSEGNVKSAFSYYKALTKQICHERNINAVVYSGGRKKKVGRKKMIRFAMFDERIFVEQY